ncbi:MAG TPA: Hsp20 family protein, partial [Geobacterales bacterium]|nr:Hsp20 family protein [Geobacterales bacterium]
RKQDRELKQEHFHRIERYHGPFHRSFTIPGTIDQDNIRATCTNGVLTITLPKRPAATAKPITIEIT